MDNNGLLTISGSGAMYDYEELEDLPWVSYWDEVTRIVVENGITAIGKQSLAGFSLVTQISLPSTLKTIGTYAFVDCTSLTSLQIPSGVTTISDGAFGYCHSLKSVTIPGTVQTLGTAIFYECYALTNVTLSEGLTTLSGGMFAYCTALQEITIPASVDTLKSSPFDGCTALESITFMGDAPTFASNSFKTVVATAYYPADNNTWTDSVCQDYGGDIMWISYGNGPVVPGDISWSFNNGVLTFSGTGAIADYESYSEVPWTNEYWGQIERVVINPGITHIGAYSFEFCFDLTSIEIPDTVTSIGTCAFYGAGLSTVTIPKNVTYIGNQAFDYCENLTRIQVASGNTAFYNDSRGALFTRNHHLIQVPGAISGHYSIPDGTVAIDDVGYCPNLTSLTIPASVSFLEPMLLRSVDTVLQVRFLGDAPEFNHSYVPPFDDYIVTIYYPSGNPTWTRSVRDAMGINITWVAYDPNDIPEDEPDNPSGELTNPFRDVKETDYFYNPVLWAVDNQITGGTSATTFGPHNACTRAQVVTFLWAAAGKPEPGSYHNPFTDVKTSDYFYKAVLWAVEKGITSGVSPTQFGSHQVCTRGQVVTFLWRAAGSPEASDSQIPFTDVKASDYFCKAVLWAVENGVTSGVSPGKFGPGNTCTRGQVVTFLYRAFNG